MNADLIESAVTAFVIGAGGAVVTMLANGDTITRNGWTVAIGTGLVIAAKDIRSFKRMPPVPTNGTSALASTTDTTTITKTTTINEKNPPRNVTG